MCTIKPIHHDEIAMYIGKKIKMILNKNINIDSIFSAINNNKNKIRIKIRIKIRFIYLNMMYKFIHEYKLEINDIDNLIYKIINDFEIKLNELNDNMDLTKYIT